MPDELEKLKSLKLKDRTKKKKEETSLIGDVVGFLENTAADIERKKFEAGQQMLGILNEPGRLAKKGVLQMNENPVAGGLNLANSLLSLTASPFGLIDVSMRQLPGGEWMADAIAYPFEQAGLGFQEGTKVVQKGLEEIPGYSKEGEVKLLEKMGLDEKKQKEVTEALETGGEMLAQFTVGGALHKGGVGIKNRLTTQKPGKVTIDPNRGEQYNLETGERRDLPVKYAERNRKFQGTETGSVFKDLTKQERIDLGQLKLQRDGITNTKMIMNDRLEGLKGVKGKDAAKQRKELKKQIKELDEMTAFVDESIRGFTEGEVKRVKGLLPKETTSMPGDFTGKNRASNIDFAVATEPGPKTTTKMGTEKVLGVKRNIHDYLEDRKLDIFGLEKKKTTQPIDPITLKEALSKAKEDGVYAETLKELRKEAFRRGRTKDFNEALAKSEKITKVETPKGNRYKGKGGKWVSAKQKGLTDASEIKTMREEGKQVQTEETGVGDLREVNKTKTAQEEIKITPDEKGVGFELVEKENRSDLRLEKQRDNSLKVIASQSEVTGKGLGTKIYESAIKYAKEKGIKLTSDNKLSESAYKTWQGLKKKHDILERPTTKLGDEYTQVESKPIFEIRQPKPLTTEGGETAGTFQSIGEYGHEGDILRAIEQVKSGRKPVGLDIPDNFRALAEKEGLKFASYKELLTPKEIEALKNTSKFADIVDTEILYKNRDNAVRFAKTYLKARQRVKKGNWDTEFGEALGFTKKEIAEYNARIKKGELFGGKGKLAEVRGDKVVEVETGKVIEDLQPKPEGKKPKSGRTPETWQEAVLEYLDQGGKVKEGGDVKYSPENLRNMGIPNRNMSPRGISLDILITELGFGDQSYKLGLTESTLVRELLDKYPTHKARQQALKELRGEEVVRDRSITEDYDRLDEVVLNEYLDPDGNLRITDIVKDSKKIAKKAGVDADTILEYINSKEEISTKFEFPDDVFAELKKEVPNAEEIIKQRPVEELDKSAKDIESKAKSRKETELNKAVEEANELITSQFGKKIEKIEGLIADEKAGMFGGDKNVIKDYENQIKKIKREQAEAESTLGIDAEKVKKEKGTRPKAFDIEGATLAELKTFENQLKSLGDKITEADARILDKISKRIKSKEGTGKQQGLFETQKDFFDVPQAKKNLRDKGLGQTPGLIDASMYKDLAVIGADYFVKGAKKFGEWSKKMREEFGTEINPHLLKLWKMVKETPKEEKPVKVQGITEAEFIKNRELFAKRHKTTEKLKESAKGEGRSVRLWTRKNIKPKDTRLYEIDPEIYRAVKKADFNKEIKHRREEKVATNLLDPLRKVENDTWADLDLLTKNLKEVEIRKILKEQGLEKQFDKVNDMLDKFRVELGIEKKGFYWPREVKNYEMYGKRFYEILEEKTGKDFTFKVKDIFDRLIQDKEAKIGDKLPAEEKWRIVNNTIRGYNPGVRLSKFSNEFKRVVKVVDAEMSQYLHDFDASLMSYIERARTQLEVRKFFGKKSGDSPAVNEYSIGRLIVEGKLRTEKPLNAENVRELTKILKSGFEPKGAHGWVATVKELGYVTRLFNYLGAMTQLGDYYVTFYRSPVRGFAPLTRAFASKTKLVKPSEVQMRKLGYDVNQMAREFSDPRQRGKLMRKTSEWSLFKGIDVGMKETQVNNMFQKYRRLAKANKLKKGHPDYWRFEKRFGNKADEVIREFAKYDAENMTGRQAFQLWDELDANQPISVWSTPEGFHTSGQMQIAWQMKTFAIRRLDFLLNESVRRFRNKELSPKERRRAGKNLAYLLGAIVLTEGSIDTAKDIVKGKDVNISDTILDNMLGLVLMSRYDVNKINRDGLGSAIFDKLSPVLGTVDDIGSDLIGLFSGDFKFKTMRNIPLVGELIYNWIKDSAKNNKRNKRR